MTKIGIIMIIRYPNVDGDNRVETITDVLEDDTDMTLINWIFQNLKDFFDDDLEITYNYNSCQQFLNDQYDNDTDDSTFPFKISYIDLDLFQWRYIKDRFIEIILDKWRPLHHMLLTNDYNNDDTIFDLFEDVLLEEEEDDYQYKMIDDDIPFYEDEMKAYEEDN